MLLGLVFVCMFEWSWRLLLSCIFELRGDAIVPLAGIRTLTSVLGNTHVLAYPIPNLTWPVNLLQERRRDFTRVQRLVIEGVFYLSGRVFRTSTLSSPLSPISITPLPPLAPKHPPLPIPHPPEPHSNPDASSQSSQTSSPPELSPSVLSPFPDRPETFGSNFSVYSGACAARSVNTIPYR